MRNKVVLSLGFSLVDPMCSGPVMSLTDVAHSLFPVQAAMAAVQVFSVRLSNRQHGEVNLKIASRSRAGQKYQFAFKKAVVADGVNFIFALWGQG